MTTCININFTWCSCSKFCCLVVLPCIPREYIFVHWNPLTPWWYVALLPFFQPDETIEICLYLYIYIYIYIYMCIIYIYIYTFYSIDVHVYVCYPDIPIHRVYAQCLRVWHVRGGVGSHYGPSCQVSLMQSSMSRASFHPGSFRETGEKTFFTKMALGYLGHGHCSCSTWFHFGISFDFEAA